MSETRTEQAQPSESSARSSTDSSARSERGDLGGGGTSDQRTSSSAGSDGSGAQSRQQAGGDHHGGAAASERGEGRSEAGGSGAVDAASRNERGSLGGSSEGGGMSKHAASVPGKDGSGARETRDPRTVQGGETQAKQGSVTETAHKQGATGEGAKQTAGQAEGKQTADQGQRKEGAQASKDTRTEQQIAQELEKRTGKSVGELIHSLGHGPVQMTMRQLEKALEANGTIQHRIEDHTPPKVIDNVIVPHPNQERRFITEGRVGTEEQVDRAKQQGLNQAIEGIWSGIKSGAAGLASRGSASDGLVKPNPGMQGRTYEPRTGAHKPDAPTMREMAPMRPGEAKEARGFQNEKEVARITGGTLARQQGHSEKGALKDAEIPYRTAGGHGGVAKVDVYGSRGEYIAVGGPGKDKNLNHTIDQLHDLKRAADMNGVEAKAYFTSDTPAQVLDAARNILGAGNVQTFNRPDYKLR